MSVWLRLGLLVLMVVWCGGTSLAADCSDVYTLKTAWDVGMCATLTVSLPSATDSFKLTVTFSSAVSSVEAWAATVAKISDTVYEFDSMGAVQATSINIDFNAYFDASTGAPTVTSVKLGETELCYGGGGGSTTTPGPHPPTHSPTGPPVDLPYDYTEVMDKSLLFYEAQRSGHLPPDNRVPWRGDSAMGDKGHNGEDLTGGYYDAGDFVKFGFPMAASVTNLAWGLIDFADAYQATGLTQRAQEAVRWGTDYFIKCHVSDSEFYGQVADPYADHASWGRPEDMTMNRPSYSVTSSAPGSDLTGETAAALAAASIVFKDTDPSYSATLLQHAKDLYTFANTYRGKYTDTITSAAEFYNSWSGYGDELGWSAAWLYRSTNDDIYLNDAKSHYDEFSLGDQATEFSWDSKQVGVQILLYQATNDRTYGTAAQGFCDYILNSAPRTPKGLVFLNAWGSLRYATNAAFVCLELAELGVNAEQYRKLAKQQVDYALGDSGHSFVVGFGVNPPQRPHHRSASCPDSGPCGWDQFNSPDPSPHVLYGAMVGGPDQGDGWSDDRTNSQTNEVACDYNAGLQSAVAGLYSLYLRGLYPA